MLAFAFSRPLFWVFGILVLSTAGCRPEAQERILRLDFENIESLGNPLPDWVTSERAHSGQYACVAHASTEFAAGQEFPYQQLNQARRLRLRVWTWLPQGQVKISVVVQIQRGDALLFWEDLRLGQLVTRRLQWEPVEQDLLLPTDLLPDDNVKLFVWKISPTPDNIYLDDITLDKVY